MLRSCVGVGKELKGIFNGDGSCLDVDGVSGVVSSFGLDIVENKNKNTTKKRTYIESNCKLFLLYFIVSSISPEERHDYGELCQIRSRISLIYSLLMSKQRDTDDLPDAPDAFTCSITYCRMVDPVFTADGHSYERSAIEEWFKNKTTSPKTGLPLDSKALLPNLTLQTQIKEWVDDQRKGRADKQTLQIFTANLVNVSTSKEGQVVVQKMIELVTSSNFCLLSPDGVERLKNIVDGFSLLDPALSDMFDFLVSQCQSEINTKQEMHRELNKKCNVLDSAKTTIINQEDDFKNMVVKTKKKAVAAAKKIPAAQRRFDAAQKHMQDEEYKRNHKQTYRVTKDRFDVIGGEVIMNRPNDVEQPLGFEFKINPTTGQMLISAIHPNGLADKAGLRTYDIITHINKEWIVEMEEEGKKKSQTESKKKMTKKEIKLNREKQKKATQKRILALCHQQPVVSLDFLRFVNVRPNEVIDVEDTMEMEMDNDTNKANDDYGGIDGMGNYEDMGMEDVHDDEDQDGFIRNGQQDGLENEYGNGYDNYGDDQLGTRAGDDVVQLDNESHNQYQHQDQDHHHHLDEDTDDGNYPDHGIIGNYVDDNNQMPQQDIELPPHVSNKKRKRLDMGDMTTSDLSNSQKEGESKDETSADDENMDTSAKDTTGTDGVDGVDGIDGIDGIDTNELDAAKMNFDAAKKNLDAITKAVKDTKKKHKKAEKNLVVYKQRVIDHSKLCSEYSNERENIERQLESMNATEGVDSGSNSSSSSSSSVPTGSKRGRSSSSSSSSSSSTTRGSKRAKKEKDGGIEMHPGQWLYEEGIAYWNGLDFKKEDKDRGQLMIEASASSGFPMAVADCHLFGWNGLKEDDKKAFDMFVKIEKETNGYHWSHYRLGRCYHYGIGVEEDAKKRFEYYSSSSEQGNSAAMLSLGYCYSKGEGTDVNKTEAFEWYEKSANLGNCNAMNNVGGFYHVGSGVTKDLNRAREWYTKAVAQGKPGAQQVLDELNAQ
jgi:hypothetical protein